MVIENDCLKSRKAQAVQSLGPLSQSKGGDRPCRRHHFNHVAKPPVWIAVLTGAQIRTAEAVQTYQDQYCAFGSESQGDSSHAHIRLEAVKHGHVAVGGWKVTQSAKGSGPFILTRIITLPLSYKRTKTVSTFRFNIYLQFVKNGATIGSADRATITARIGYDCVSHPLWTERTALAVRLDLTPARSHISFSFPKRAFRA